MDATSYLSELSAGLLQATITIGLVALCLYLYATFRKAYFLWWGIAWAVYVLRIGAILGFLIQDQPLWLYWHQVTTGWTALMLLTAALSFSRRLVWRWWYAAVLSFPPLWSYVAIYRLDNFLLAAGPAVLFLSIATMWTGVVFLRQWRRTRSHGAAVLGWTFAIWALHHLDYPLLRARGAWSPWGYYLDIMFVLGIGAGILLVVTDDLRRGLGALSALSGDLQGGGEEADVLDRLLDRPLTLPGVRGTAIFLANTGAGDGGTFVRGAGSCATLTGTTPVGVLAELIDRAVTAGRPRASRARRLAGADGQANGRTPPYAAVLPVMRGGEVYGALVIVGDARDPFTVLDESFLVALGQQVGASLENAELYRRLRARTADLERLGARMVEQNEEQRRSLSSHLHDETAQVFSAVKMQLGLVREHADAEAASRLDRVLTLVDSGIASIRNLTNDLRPSLLDDLGLLPALRALAIQFGERSDLTVRVDGPEKLPQLSREAELALFRALQEALANVARHAAASTVLVSIGSASRGVELRVADDGNGPANPHSLSGSGRMGLLGMRERITALGGTLVVRERAEHGVELIATVPSSEQPE